MTDHRNPGAPPGQSLSRRRFLASTAALPLAFQAATARAETGAFRPFSARIIHSGHSLTDPIVPVLDAMVAALGGRAARGRVMARSTIPGSPMDWRWNNRPQYGPDARHEIAGYEVLVITERVSLANTMPWHNSAEMALRWFTHAWEKGNGGKGAASLLYATWVDLDSGPGYDNPHKDPEGHLPFGARMPLEMARWQAIADQVNAARPAGSPPMRVIPGPLIMAAAERAILAGDAPGLHRLADLFRDEIHPNEQGAYLMALAHLAVIYGVDPRALKGGLGGVATPRPATAAWMQSLVHEILQNYPDAGYPGTP